MYKASKNFHKYFPEKKFSTFLDKIFSYLTGTHELDVSKSDDFHHEKNGDNEKRETNSGSLKKEVL